MYRLGFRAPRGCQRAPDVQALDRVRRRLWRGCRRLRNTCKGVVLALLLVMKVQLMADPAIDKLWISSQFERTEYSSPRSAPHAAASWATPLADDARLQSLHFGRFGDSSACRRPAAVRYQRPKGGGGPGELGCLIPHLTIHACSGSAGPATVTWFFGAGVMCLAPQCIKLRILCRFGLLPSRGSCPGTCSAWSRCRT